MVTNDDEYRKGQEEKLSQVIRCASVDEVPVRLAKPRCKSTSMQRASAVRNLQNSLPSKISQGSFLSRSQTSSRLNFHDFKRTSLNLCPRQRPRQYLTQSERIDQSLIENAIYDTTPKGNTEIGFSKLLRQTQRNRSKDLGAPVFKHDRYTVDRMMAVQLSPHNEKPIAGIDKYKTARETFEEKKATWFMPEAVDGRHEVILEETSPWSNNLIQIKNAQKFYSHYH